jgi:hypothetical protein
LARTRRVTIVFRLRAIGAIGAKRERMEHGRKYAEKNEETDTMMKRIEKNVIDMYAKISDAMLRN